MGFTYAICVEKIRFWIDLRHPIHPMWIFCRTWKYYWVNGSYSMYSDIVSTLLSWRNVQILPGFLSDIMPLSMHKYICMESDIIPLVLCGKWWWLFYTRQIARLQLFSPWQIRIRFKKMIFQSLVTDWYHQIASLMVNYGISNTYVLEIP